MIDLHINLIRGLVHAFYLKQYGLDIIDGNQVLLISHVKKFAGAAPLGPAMLVPELCYLTGYRLILQCVHAD